MTKRPNRSNPKLKLTRIQRMMAEGVMRPLTADFEMQKKWKDGTSTEKYASKFIKPNDRLTSFERLEIYNKQYWFRLIDCIIDDFPGVRSIVGEKKFDALVEKYLIKHPSTSFTLRNLGKRFPDFLKRNPSLTKPRTQLACDMARLEWAKIEAFDGPGEKPLALQDLAKKTPDKLFVGVQPYLSLLEFHYPVDDFALAMKKVEILRTEAVTKGKKSRKKIRAVPLPKKTHVTLVVHRMNNMVYYKRVHPAAFALLTALKQGTSLQDACEIAFRTIQAKELSKKNWLLEFQAWFKTWAELQWLCKPLH